MNEMNFYTLNGEQYEVADKKAREANTATNESLKLKADISYMNQAFAPALPITLMGVAVSTDMVSQVEHEVRCKISGVPDLTAVTVSRYGSNLIDPKTSKISYGDGQSVPTDVAWFDDNGVYHNKASLYYVSTYASTGIKYVNTNTIIYIKAQVRIPSKKGDTQINVAFAGEGPSVGKYITANFENWVDINVMLSGFEEQKVGVFGLKLTHALPTREELLARNLSVSIVDAPYEPYKKTDYTPDSNGVISGMLSVSPNMTILTDNPNATVEATYNADTKKYIDKTIAELQAAILSTGGNV